MILINREKAESIVRDRLRVERAPRLAELDVKFVRALEQGADTAEIVSEKSALRDVTKKPLDALTVEELASIDLDWVLAL